MNSSHNTIIIEQFTKQAAPFANLPAHLDAMQLLLEMSGVDKNKSVLDVACGPGLVSCAFAKHAKSVHGVDITEKMIIEAQQLQQKENLDNITFDIGDVNYLPYPDQSFDIVLSRYTFHHFIEPKRVLEEMIRVCKIGGTVMVADVALPNEKVDLYNQMERLRDPSHTQALTHTQFAALFTHPDLSKQKQGAYTVNMQLDKILKSSFPNPGDEKKLRKMFEDDLGQDKLGVSAHVVDNQIHFAFPITIYCAIHC